MTVGLTDAAAAPVGGPTHLGLPEAALAQAAEAPLKLHYRPPARGRVYRVIVAPARLTALIEPTEEGFVATCPQMASLGYGSTPEAALADLSEATREYLSMLVEHEMPLSPRVAHHALYLPLLHVSEASWFAAVVTVGEPRRDAS